MRVAHPQRGLDAAQGRDLVEAHYDDVFAYCRRRMRTADEAQDATQEVFLRFVRTADRYRDAGKLLAHLLTIARNVCADVGRAQSPPLADLPDDDVLGASCTSGQEGLDRGVGEADLQRALRRARHVAKGHAGRARVEVRPGAHICGDGPCAGNQPV